MSRTLVAVVGLFAFAAPLSAQGVALGFDDFSWTLAGDPGAGPASLTSDTMTVVGPDNTCVPGGPQATWYEATAAFSGTVSMHIQFSSSDICHFDWAAKVIEGVPTTAGLGDGCDGFLNPVSFHVIAGQTFGLGVQTEDCIMGPGTAVFTQFSYTPDPVSVWVDAGGELDPRLQVSVEALSPGEGVGHHALVVGDVNADGFADVAISRAADELALCSGFDGSTLWWESGAIGLDRDGLAPGDLDGDGSPDLIVARPDGGTLAAHRGHDGQTLWEWYLPAGIDPTWNAGLLDDRDGDGVRDLAVAGYDFVDLEGVVFLVSGADGSQLPLGQWPVNAGLFGASVDGVGDVDGDGIEDVFVGSPAWPSSFQSGHAYVFGGADGALIHDLVTPNAVQFPDFGVGVSGAGDVNSDGVPDLLVASPGANDDVQLDTGAVLLYDGATGLLGQTLFGDAPGDFLGTRMIGELDFNVDGNFEMAVSTRVPPPGSGAGFENTGRVNLLRTVGGQLLVQLDGNEAGEQFGRALHAYTEDGGASYLGIGAPSGSGGGRVTIWHQLAHPGAPDLSGAGQPLPGETWSLTLSGGPAGAASGLVIGTSLLNAAFKGGTLVPSPTLIAYLNLDATGGWTLGGVWPGDIPAAVPLWMQAWVSDPAGPLGWTATSTLRTTQL